MRVTGRAGSGVWQLRPHPRQRREGGGLGGEGERGREGGGAPPSFLCFARGGGKLLPLDLIRQRP